MGMGGNGNRDVWENGNEALDWEWDGNDSTGMGTTSHSRTPLSVFVRF